MHSPLKLALFALVLVAATALVTAGLLNAAAPQEKPDEAAIMRKFLEAARPGKPHRDLARHCGRWNMAGRFYNGSRIERSTGSAVFEMALGGRFLVQRNQGTWAGRRYAGLQIIGYDNVTKKYQSVWMDSMSSGMIVTEGAADERGCIHMRGTVRDVFDPEGRPFLHSLVPRGDDEFTVEIWQVVQGEKRKCADFVYTRREK